MNRDEHNDPAWELLRKARETEVSPFFARNVVREVRQMEDERHSGGFITTLQSLFTIRRVAFAAAAVLVVTLILNHDRSTSEESGGAVAETEAVSPVIAPVEGTAVAGASPAAEPDTDFDIRIYEEEVEMIDVLDSLLAVQDVAALDDEALAELLF